MTLSAASPTKSPSLGLPAALLASAAVVAVLLVSGNEFGPIAAAASTNIVAFLIAAKRLRPLPLSPPFILGAYMSAIALGGYLFSNALTGHGGTGGVDVRLPQDVVDLTASRMMLGSSLVLIGASLVSGGGGGPVDMSGLRSAMLSVTRLSGPILAISTLHITILLLLLGPGFLERQNRLVGRGSSLEAVAQMLAVGATVVLGIIFFARVSRARWYALLLIGVYSTYFFALGSRRLALIPVLLLLALAVARNGKVRPISVICVAVVSPALLALPLYLRGQATHGLVPYAHVLPQFALDSNNYLTSLNNILAGFKISALTGFVSPDIPSHYLWISLTPEQGRAAGWYEIAPEMLLTNVTPYSGIGELMNYGGAVFWAGFWVLGLALGLAHRMNVWLLAGSFTKYIAIAVLGLTVVFTVQMGQYNLRSDVRYLYLILGLQVATVIGAILLRGVQRRHYRS